MGTTSETTVLRIRPRDRKIETEIGLQLRTKPEPRAEQSAQEDRETKLLVFASGSKDGGGSGFLKLIEAAATDVLDVKIVGVVSNHEAGGVQKIAESNNVPFFIFSELYTAERYQEFVEATKADFIALSGWLKLVAGLDPATTINIHPGPLPRFGGPGMYGHHVHEAVLDAFCRGEDVCSAVSMHFVSSEYDTGPVFFSYPVAVFDDDTPDAVATRVNRVEHGWQSFITNLVITGTIHLQGEKVFVPSWYAEMPFCPTEEYIHVY